MPSGAPALALTAGSVDRESKLWPAFPSSADSTGGKGWGRNDPLREPSLRPLLVLTRDGTRGEKGNDGWWKFLPSGGPDGCWVCGQEKQTVAGFSLVCRLQRRDRNDLSSLVGAVAGPLRQVPQAAEGRRGGCSPCRPMVTLAVHLPEVSLGTT